MKHLKDMDELSFRFGKGNFERDTIDRVHSLLREMVGKSFMYRRLAKGDR